MEIPSAETSAWNLAQGGAEDKPKVIRYRPDLESFLGSSNYPKRLVIIWFFESDNTSGMPSEQQSDEMKLFENAIVGTLDPDRLAILAFVLTNDGCREWHFYVDNIQEVGNRINSSLSNFPKLPLHLQVEDDPDWEELSNVYNICK